MKWKNKGHEFDHVYKNIEAKKSFYLFGAGDYGRQFLHMMKNEIEIKGFIDNSLEKQRTIIDGLACDTFEHIDFQDKSIGIILTVSQIQRGKIIVQLKKAGYILNEDFFIIEDFLSIYYVYKYDEVFFSAISLLPSTTCNLKCEACLNFNPYAKTFYVRSLTQVMNDIDVFFKCVDRIMLFHVSGGEPMLYKDIAEVIMYIDKTYGDRIHTIRTVTNGTVIPSDEVLEKLSKCNVEITVDDYREAVPQYNNNFDALLKKLEQFHIRYYINKADEWIDLAPDRTNFSSWTEAQLQQHFEECCQSWQELRDGKLYSCNYDAYATVAGINEMQDEEVFDLANFTSDKKKELVEFRLGYNGKGYTNFCKKCRGFSEKNSSKLIPAKQKM